MVRPGGLKAGRLSGTGLWLRAANRLRSRQFGSRFTVLAQLFEGVAKQFVKQRYIWVLGVTSEEIFRFLQRSNCELKISRIELRLRQP